jgi:two-component system CheB/CheR fusion protein
MAQNLRILVVDDNEDNVTTTTLLLRAHGHEVHGCHRGAEAMRFVVTFEPDVVLLDLNMPEKNGWEIAAEIRARSTVKRPVLIAISGKYIQASDRALSQLRGFDHHLAKPVDPDALLALIKRLSGPLQ